MPVDCADTRKVAAAITSGQAELGIYTGTAALSGSTARTTKSLAAG